MYELTAAHLEIQQKARQIAQENIAPRAADVDREEAYPWDNVEVLDKAGFLGMTLPTKYGGKGASFLDAVLVVEEMAKVCGVTGRIVVEANMGAVSAIMLYGSEEQKKLAAEIVLAGDKPAICITEPDAGSAATDECSAGRYAGHASIHNWSIHGELSRRYGAGIQTDLRRQLLW